MDTSKLFFLNHKDWIKSAVMLVGSAVLGLVINCLQNGTHIDWKQVGITAVVTFLTYLLKQLGTDTNGKLGGVL